MKRIFRFFFLLVLFVLGTITLYSQNTFPSLKVERSVSFGSWVDRPEPRFNDLSFTSDAGLVIAGTYRYLMDCDPGDSEFIMGSENDPYRRHLIVKLDSNLDFQWARSPFAHQGESSIYTVKTTRNDEIVVLGNVDGRINLNYDYFPSAYRKSSFIQKFYSNGTVAWTKELRNCEISGNANALEIGEDGSVYVTGSYQSTVVFDTLSPNATLNSSRTGMFLCKYSAQGVFQWVKSWGNQNLYFRPGVTLDDYGRIYIVGVYYGSLDADPDPDSTHTLPGVYARNLLIAQLDSTGELNWAKSIGSHEIYANDLHCNNGLLVIAGGYSTGFMDLDPGPLDRNLASGQSFILQLDTLGNYQSVFAHDHPPGPSAVLDNGSVLQSTYFRASGGAQINDTVKIDLGYAGLTTTDAMLVQLSSAMQFEGVKIHRTGGNDYLTCLNHNNDRYAASSVQYLGTRRAAIYLYSFCDAVQYTDTIASCDQYTWQDNKVYSDPTMYDYMMRDTNGCSELRRLNLSLRQSSWFTDYQTSCGAITWLDGKTYGRDTSGVFFTTLNKAGCDSVIQLVYNYAVDTVYDNRTICEPFTWVDGNVYSADVDSVYYTLTNQYNCDSVMVLNVESKILNTQITYDKANNRIVCSPDYFSKWITCDGLELQSFSLENFFIPKVNGQYAAIIRDSYCVDTTLCVEVDNLNFSGVYYGNPMDDILYLYLPSKGESAINIYDISGKLVFSTTSKDVPFVQYYFPLEASYYVVEVQYKNQVEYHKLLNL